MVRDILIHTSSCQIQNMDELGTGTEGGGGQYHYYKQQNIHISNFEKPSESSTVIFGWSTVGSRFFDST